MSRELLVVKYGSSCVAGPEGLDQGRIDGYAGQLAEASRVYDIVVVSSGSIAVGKSMWRQNEAEAAAFLGDDYDAEQMPDDEVLASMGSAPAVVAWQQALRQHRASDGRLIRAGQIQVTHHEVRDKQEGPMLLNTMRKCLDRNVVSIVNENDALSDEEFKKVRYGGDNDGLARHVAAILEADRLCLLTARREGLMDEDDQLVDIVKSRNSNWALSLVRDPEEGDGTFEEEEEDEGTGGMHSKVQAAIAAAGSGIRTHIANPKRPILDIIDRKYGTYFAPH